MNRKRKITDLFICTLSPSSGSFQSVCSAAEENQKQTQDSITLLSPEGNCLQGSRTTPNVEYIKKKFFKAYASQNSSNAKC